MPTFLQQLSLILITVGTFITFGVGLGLIVAGCLVLVDGIALERLNRPVQVEA